jgi:hypothetical protein
MEFEPPHIVLTRVAIPLAYQSTLAVFNGMFWINLQSSQQIEVEFHSYRFMSYGDLANRFVDGTSK